ncbi:PDZ domain-containing protein [Geminisphaera colitermitum]|uniref:PDZ domain-containing protein n=1 Tax=Geminisphaera colitermitum TaxID=1148786 RepID=UPI000158CAC2|nr:PDZ domain-containing protein [Geminisphaera colitermitum]
MRFSLAVLLMLSALVARPVVSAQAGGEGGALPTLPALLQERTRALVAVEFFTETELDRRPTIANGVVVDAAAGTIVLPSQVINMRTSPSQLKDFRVYLPGRSTNNYAKGEYLGQDPLSGWHFVRVEEKLRAQLTPVTAFVAKAAAGAEPAAGEEFWGIGLRGKDEDFLPYFLAGHVSLIQSLPDRTAIALSEVTAPGLPVFDREGHFAGLGIGGFGATYLQFSRTERGSPVMLMNVEETAVFQLAADVLPKLGRVPASVDGRPIPTLGVYGLQPMDPEVAAFLKLDNQSGCVVSEVLDGGPAEAAGMKDRDIIVALDGKPLPRFKPDSVVVSYIDREVARRTPGEKVPVTVLRGTERVELIVTLGEEPKLQREAERKYFERLGLTVREFVFGDGVVRRIKRAEQRGVIAYFVKNNGLTATAGLRPDDWIQEVDGVVIKTYAEAVEKLAAIEADTSRGEFVLLTSRGGETAVLRVKLK